MRCLSTAVCKAVGAGVDLRWEEFLSILQYLEAVTYRDGYYYAAGSLRYDDLMAIKCYFFDDCSRHPGFQLR